MSAWIALPAKCFRAAPQQKFADFANRRTAANYDTVVCTTGFAREEFDRIGATNTVTVPLGVDLETFHPARRCAQLRRRFATPARSCWCTAAGCRWRSGPTAASTRWPRCATPASTPDWSSSATARCGPGCSVRPPTCRSTSPGSSPIGSAVAALLATADVALAPGPHETFGLAALESLACGTPAVVSRTSALTEIITADSGALADNDPTAIAHAVSDLVSRPERHRRGCARHRAEMFTWQRSAAGMLTTFR